MDNDLKDSLLKHFDKNEIELRIVLGTALGVGEYSMFLGGFNLRTKSVLINHFMLEKVLNNPLFITSKVNKFNKDSPICIGSLLNVPLIYVPYFDNDKYMCMYYHSNVEYMPLYKEIN